MLFLCRGILQSVVAITLGSGHDIGRNNLMCNIDHRNCAIIHYDRVQYKIIRGVCVCVCACVRVCWGGGEVAKPQR